MHDRVQCLQPAVHHLREPGQVGDLPDRKPGLRKLRAGAARGHELDPAPVQHAGEIDEPGLVRDGEERALHAAQIAGHDDTGSDVV